MKIASVKLHNWMGYKGTHEIHLEDKDVVGVICEYKDDKEASNQGGKTSVIESILYACTGNSRANKDVELIHYGEDAMWVEVTLIDDDGRTYLIRRGRDHKNKGVLELDWITKTPEAQAEIDKLIGFDKKDFELITYFKQAEITQFMDMTSAKKKEFIVQWFDLGHWEKLEKAVKEEIKELKIEHGETRAKIEALEESFDNDIDLETELEVNSDAVSTVLTKIKNLKKKIGEYQKKVKVSEDDYIKAKQTIKKQKQRIIDVEEIVDRNNEIGDKISIYAKKLKTLQEKIVVEIREGHSQVVDHTKEAEKLEDLIGKAKKYKTGMCPILNESCDRIKFDPKQVKGWESAYEKSIKQKNYYKNQVELNIKEGELESKIDKLKARIKKDEWHGHITDAEACIEEADKVIKSYDKSAEAKLEKLEDMLEELDDEKSELQNTVTRLKEKLDAKEKNEKRVEKLKIKLKKIASELDDKNYLAMMFGKNGIPSLEIENGFEEVESEANFALQEMNPEMDITFKPTKELGTKEPTCLSCGWTYPKGFRGSDCKSCGTPRRMKTKDEIQFSVAHNGEDYQYYMDSGGGKSILALSMRIALTQLKRRLGGANLNVVFLDEPDSALDKRYLRQFVKLVTNTLTKKLGIEQVIWISHHKEIQNQVPHTLKVIKDGKEAKTTWT